MSIAIGVIGVGMIGQDHIRRLTRAVAGARVVAVTDVDVERTRKVASSLPVPATAHGSGAELIDDPQVQAVMVTSWGPTHEEYVLASLAAGKPVFCEKPLATTQDACRRIIDAEVSGGRRLLQVGYMRRYDAAFRAVKEVIDSGDIGQPLMVHSRHRNPTVPDFYTREMAITDTAVHDFDAARWLLGEELVSVAVRTPRQNRHGGELQDPLLMLLESSSGALVDVETSVNIRYGYDIQTEVVGEDGTVAIADTAPVLVRRAGTVAGRVPADWSERFGPAYTVELQEWVDGLADSGTAAGPSAWDGYAAAAVGEAGVQALHTGRRTEVRMAQR